MEKPIFFNSITIKLPKEKIYKRLGYKSKVTRLSKIKQKEIEKYIRDALLFIELKGAALITKIERKPKGAAIGGKVFKSKLLLALLKNSADVLLCGVTAGSRIMDEIKKCEQLDLTRAVIFDAVASEMADSAFSWITDYFNRGMLKERKCLTKKRISCGYHDFSIKYQKDIYNLLKIKKIGVGITKSYMLLPEKSATAVLGVIDI
ncbi:MAG: hypothetical protein WCY05_03380 [Candidatus Omnitrophota bacterium]